MKICAEFPQLGQIPRHNRNNNTDTQGDLHAQADAYSEYRQKGMRRIMVRNKDKNRHTQRQTNQTDRHTDYQTHRDIEAGSRI